jgi:dTDP-4-amino-4,6-dideoxygalactose transaminase
MSQIAVFVGHFNGEVFVHIPYVDIASQHAPLKAALMEAVARVIDHGQFILGPEVQEFEQRFAALCGVRYAVSVNSGTDALILALRALEIGAGDEVITVPNSFVASTSCIMLVGARPVFVDVGDDYLMDPEQLERAITPRTRAILPVHLTGRPADMLSIMDTARAHGLHVVEDCAQAVLADYKGQRVGSFGAMGCFSLHPLKTLNACGDGGVLTTNDVGLYEKLIALRNIGLQSRDRCVLWSGNSRLDTMQAAMLLVKLAYVDDWTAQRRAHARFYQYALSNIPEVRLPYDQPYATAVYHTFVIQAEQRQTLQQYLTEYGIGTAIHYPVPIHLQPVAAQLGYGPGSFPVAEQQAERILSLPIYAELQPAALEYIARSMRRFYRA